MASALERMRLYQRAYGLTELRLYSTAFMLWLAAVCCWFLVTVLRGRRSGFAIGAVVTALATVVALTSPTRTPSSPASTSTGWIRQLAAWWRRSS